ncbi:hypothetical protein VTJ04DRAFT_4746 [Mycothermus thermophilus]|uniref:uncharacterized protein n=1 Tax=Humicola insolens TaxID=85995 RepID=UPI0037448073
MLNKLPPPYDSTCSPETPEPTTVDATAATLGESAAPLWRLHSGLSASRRGDKQPETAVLKEHRSKTTEQFALRRVAHPDSKTFIHHPQQRFGSELKRREGIACLSWVLAFLHLLHQQVTNRITILVAADRRSSPATQNLLNASLWLRHCYTLG